MGARLKEPELFDAVGLDGLVAPTREVMFAFMDEGKTALLTPREIIEQCERVIAAMREVKTLAGMWAPEKGRPLYEQRLSYARVLSRIQSEIADANWETRRLRRRAKQAALDAKREAVPRFGQERKQAVDDAA